VAKKIEIGLLISSLTRGKGIEEEVYSWRLPGITSFGTQIGTRAMKFTDLSRSVSITSCINHFGFLVSFLFLSFAF